MTPNDVMTHLAALARDLDANVSALEDAELEAARKRHDADLAHSRAFLAAAGSVESRKHEAFVACERLLADADVAEAVVRHLKRRADAIRTRIDVGRTMGSTLRAEMELAKAS